MLHQVGLSITSYGLLIHKSCFKIGIEETFLVLIAFIDYNIFKTGNIWLKDTHYLAQKLRYLK